MSLIILKVGLWGLATTLGLVAYVCHLLRGPLWHMIDDSREEGPPQNRRNTGILCVACAVVAIICVLGALA